VNGDDQMSHTGEQTACIVNVKLVVVVDGWVGVWVNGGWVDGWICMCVCVGGGGVLPVVQKRVAFNVDVLVSPTRPCKDHQTSAPAPTDVIVHHCHTR
jgi:hypothetical protein